MMARRSFHNSFCLKLNLATMGVLLPQPHRWFKCLAPSGWTIALHDPKVRRTYFVCRVPNSTF
eukprot:6440109-Amphidinium_carterae.1